MSEILLKGGTVVNADGTRRADVLIKDGVIAAIGENLPEAEETLFLSGKLIFPGFIDLHAHFREPGFEGKEDIGTGSRAAVAGGFTQVCVMPNTSPVIDNAALVRYEIMRGEETGLCRVRPIGAVTKGEKGEELAEMGKMKAAGAVAVSDDGKPVSNAQMMRLAMEYASDFGLVVLSHCEDKDLAEGGVVNEGFASTAVGLKGIPRAAEEIMAARDILLAETLGLRVHLCHLSTKGSVQLVRDAKKRGVRVTCETCPHYFSATDEIVLSLDPVTKVNPPVRERADADAVVEGLRDGTIDAIATDHAPHAEGDKNVEYNLAAFGISGLETAFALAYTKLVKEEGFSVTELARLMSLSPAAVLDLPGGAVREGMPADIAVADVDREWQIDASAFYSKGKNTPFDGRTVTGKVIATIVGGKIVYREEERK